MTARPVQQERTTAFHFLRHQCNGYAMGWHTEPLPFLRWRGIRRSTHGTTASIGWLKLWVAFAPERRRRT